MSQLGQTRTFRDVRLNVRFTPDKQTSTGAVRRSASCHQLTLTRHFGLTKLTPSLQIDLTKIHCVHLRYSILARHQIAAEPACRFLQPRRRLGRDGSLFVAPVLRRRNQPPPPSMPCTSNRRVSAPAFRSFAISRYWADSKNPRKAVAFEKDRSTILSLSQRPSMISGCSSAANSLPPNCLSTPLKRAA